MAVAQQDAEAFENRLVEGRLRCVLAGSLAHLAVAQGAPETAQIEITNLHDDCAVFMLDAGTHARQQTWLRHLQRQCSKHGSWRGRRGAIADVAEHEGLARLACARVAAAGGRPVASVAETFGTAFARTFANANSARTSAGAVVGPLSVSRQSGSGGGTVTPAIATPVVATPYRATPKSMVRWDGMWTSSLGYSK